MALETHNLLRIVLPLLVLPTGLLVHWKLFPRFSPPARKLALVLLLAQFVVLMLSLQVDATSLYLRKLVHINGERNLAAGLAGLQLALVAGYALIMAAIARDLPRWQRLYFLCLGIIFLYLTWDELFVLHEHIRNWSLYYGAVGLGLAALTMRVAWRSRRRLWVWYFCILSGLAISAGGAMVLEHFRYPAMCRRLRLYYIDRCIMNYIEESMEYLGIWLVLLALLGLLSELAPLSKRRLRLLHFALPTLVLVLIVNFSDPDLPSVLNRHGIIVTELSFESGARVHGYERDLSADGDLIEWDLWLSAQPFGYDGLGYSIHLLDQANGRTLAGKDEYATVSAGALVGPFYMPIFRQTLQLSLPAVPANRAYWVVLTLWREQEGDFASQKALASDRRKLSETQIVLEELVVPAAPVALPAAPRARFANGFAFYAVDLPASAKPGDSLPLTMTWQAEAAGKQDYMQFLHLIHEASGELRAFDQPPLGARLPTRLWYSSLADSETWQIPLPADLAPGRYQVWTGLYQASDLARLPAVDADGTAYPDARVPLGYVMIESV